MHWAFKDAGIGPLEAQQWPLLDNPWHVMYMCAAYYVIVFVLTQLMKLKKEPFQLKGYSQVHNALMVLLSLYMGLEYLRCIYHYGLKFIGNEVPSDESYLPVVRIQYIFYLSKIPEWNDTFIMILKKNSRQVSILHLYHHGSIFLFSYFGCKHAPGGDSWLAACINSWVHVVMYSYYFAAPLARQPNPPRWVKALMSVKKYITMMQLVQFLIIFTRDSFMLYSIHVLGVVPTVVPAYMVLAEWLYMISMVMLFMNFYLNTYSAPVKKQAPAVKEAGSTSVEAVAGIKQE